MLINNYAFIIGMVALSSVAVGTFGQTNKGKDTLKTVILSEVTVLEKTNISSLNAPKISRKVLDIIQSNTLGETLSHIPGIQNAYFGPNSGTP
jgi:iron complex outermembrane receptor protein